MQGIVLSRRAWREFDQVISLYTPECGKVEIIAKGVRKIQSKNSASLEPGQLVQFGIAKGKEMNLLTSVAVEESFVGLRISYRRLFTASFLLDTVDRLFERGVVDQRVFLFLCTTLLELETFTGSYCLFLDQALLSLFQLLGYAPATTRCVRSGEELVQFPNVFFHAKDGGFLCPSCRQKEGEGAGYLQLTALEWSGLERFLQGRELIESENIPFLVSRLFPLYHRFTFDFVAYYSEKKIVDWGKALAV